MAGKERSGRRTAGAHVQARACAASAIGWCSTSARGEVRPASQPPASQRRPRPSAAGSALCTRALQGCAPGSQSTAPAQSAAPGWSCRCPSPPAAPAWTAPAARSCRSCWLAPATAAGHASSRGVGGRRRRVGGAGVGGGGALRRGHAARLGVSRVGQAAREGRQQGSGRGVRAGLDCTALRRPFRRVGRLIGLPWHVGAQASGQSQALPTHWAHLLCPGLLGGSGVGVEAPIADARLPERSGRPARAAAERAELASDLATAGPLSHRLGASHHRRKDAWPWHGRRVAQAGSSGNPRPPLAAGAGYRRTGRLLGLSRCPAAHALPPIGLPRRRGSCRRRCQPPAAVRRRLQAGAPTAPAFSHATLQGRLPSPRCFAASGAGPTTRSRWRCCSWASLSPRWRGWRGRARPRRPVSWPPVMQQAACTC